MFNSTDQDRQAEFFNELPGMKKRPKKGKFNLGKVVLSLSYENIIILAIGLIMLLIVCYSLGVEKGKYLARLSSEDFQTAEQEQAQRAPKIKPVEPEEQKEKVKLASRFTIQVATFRKAASAEQEIERLENKGYHPFVIPRVSKRGKFSEICIGNYENKIEASTDLKKLKKFYADCYVRNR